MTDKQAQARATAATTVRGNSYLGWLFLIMFVLKLNPGSHLDSAVTGWSWWVIWAPIWAPLAILASLSLIGGLVWLGFALTENKRRARRYTKTLKKRAEQDRLRKNRYGL